LPTHDPALDAACPEAHNASVGWQGPFRVGHPDAVLLRYALAVAGPLDGLLLSHLDLLSPHGGRSRPPLRWATAHVAADGRSWSQLPVSPTPDLDHQERLTRQLQNGSAVWGDAVRDATDWQAHLVALSGCPVAWRSDGATHHHVQPGGQ
jgi:adenylosuccinate synthase